MKRRLDKKTENQYKEKRQKHRKHKTHSKTIKTQRTYICIYTTRSDFTKALLLALQRAASDQCFDAVGWAAGRASSL